MHRNAFISPCGQYRYYLIRQWDASLPFLVYVMLNPSTADAERDDPTIDSCIRIAKAHGYGGIVVVNLYAYRATDPKALKAADYPGGDRRNGCYIQLLIIGAETAVCAWGANARNSRLPRQVIHYCKSQGVDPVAITLLSDGTPGHPLFQKVPAEFIYL